MKKSQHVGRFCSFHRKRRWINQFIALFTLCQFLTVNFAFAQAAPQIATDGRTATQLTTTGNVTNVTTSTIQNANAFNSFSRFNVYNGNTVNLFVPQGAANLLNLVRDEQTRIDGILNSLKDGKIGGNVYFANPYGIIVGASGIVNVGSLTAVTPTRSFLENFFAAPGSPDPAATAALLNGSAPINPEGLISVQGKINALKDIRLYAGAFANAGEIRSGAVFAGDAIDFSDVVNVAGLKEGAVISAENGVIEIRAAGDAANSGVIASDGGANLPAGTINIHVGNDVTLDAGSLISAQGRGENSPGGTISILADHDALFSQGALLTARGGLSGDGGFIELSAGNRVTLAGGEFRAGAANGRAGSILVDPENIEVVNANQFTDGANYTLLADESITVNPDITISTRQVAAGADHLAAASIGNSGNLTLQAPDITLSHGARLLAQGSGGYAGGMVSLLAENTALASILGYREAQAHIRIGDAGGGATIKGAAVNIRASATADEAYLYPTEGIGENFINFYTKAADGIVSLAPKALGINVVYSEAKAVADVTVKSGSLIEVDRSADLKAETTAAAGSRPLNPLGALVPLVVNNPLAVGALYAKVDASATVTVEDGARIKASHLTVRAHNDAKLDASIDAKPKDTGLDSPQTISVAGAFTDASVHSRATVGGTLNVAGNVQVAATNEASYSTEVTSRTGADGKAAAAVVITNRESGATAELTANVPDSTRVSVLAVNDITKDATTAKSTAGTTPITEIIDKLKTNVANGIQQQLYDWLKLGFLKPKATAARGSQEMPFRVSGALAYSDSTDAASATIGSAAGPGTTVHATNSVAAAARVNVKDLEIAAESAAVSNSSQTPSNSDTSRQGYAAGVAIGNYSHNAYAAITANTTITAPRIGVYSGTVMPRRESLLFGDTAPFDRWMGLSTITGAFESLVDITDVFNGVSSAKAKADGSEGSIAVGGSASFLSFNDTTRAVVDTGARLNVTGNATGDWTTESIELAPAKPAKTFWDVEYDAAKPAKTTDFTFGAAADVKAEHDAMLLFLGGPLLPSSGAEKGLGISLNDITLTSETEAVIREGTVIGGIQEVGSGTGGARNWTKVGDGAAPSVSVTAESEDKAIAIASSSGLGATFGVNGSVSILTVEETTRASVDNEATVKTDRLTVQADASPIAWSIAGAVNLSKGASVGVGIAVNDVTSDTRAEIADNDTYATEGDSRASILDIATYSAANPAGAKIEAPVVDMEAKTSGRAEAIAVTGAIANSSDVPTSPFDKIKKKYDKYIKKGNDLVSLTPSTVTKPEGGTPGTPQKPEFGLAGAGSGAVNLTDQKTKALIDGVYLDQTKPADFAGDAALTVRGISDMDIIAISGAAAVTRANSSTQTSTAGITGSVAMNLIGNGNEALMRNSTVEQAGDTTVQALSDGSQQSWAIGAAIDVSNNSSVSQSNSFTGSLALTLTREDDEGKTKNFTRARIEDSSLAGGAGVGPDVAVTAYNNTEEITVGGSAQFQLTSSNASGAGVGGGVVYSDIQNEVESRISGSTITDVYSVNVHAYNTTDQVAVGAMGAYSPKENTQNIAGAFVITEVRNETTASVDGGSAIGAFSNVSVQAKDKEEGAIFRQIINPQGRTDEERTFDFSSLGTEPGGNSIISVAGNIQATSGNNVGASVGYNLIQNNMTAQVKDSSVLAGARIDVRAESHADILGLAVGVGASNKFSGGGSIAIAEIENRVTAMAGRSAENGLTTELMTNNLTIEAADNSAISTLAGQVNLSRKTTIGAAVTYNDIANTVTARVDDAAITAPQTATVAGRNTSEIESLAVAGGLAKDAAVNGSLSFNFIGNTTEGSINNAEVDGGGTGNLAVSAEDSSTIQSLAGSVSVGKSAGAGGAFAFNQIANTNRAAVEGSDLTGFSDFTLSASETGTIETLSAAAAGGQTFALSGSISINNVGKYDGSSLPNGNSTVAELIDSTVDGGTATVTAEDSTEISSAAGSVAVALGSAAAGGAWADNLVRNTVRATVSGSSLQNPAGLTVQATNDAEINSLSAAATGAAEAALAGSLSSNRTNNLTVAEIVAAEITGGTAAVNVSAEDSAAISSLAGGLAVGLGSAGVGGATAVNKIDNRTDARVSGTKADTNGYDMGNLIVEADSTATIETLAVGVGAGASVGVAGSVAVNLMDSDTLAHIDEGAKVTAQDNVGVMAQTDDRITLAAGAAGIGISAAGVGASVTVNKISGSTEAYIDGWDTEVSALATDATHKLTVNSGSLQADVNLGQGLDLDQYRKTDLPSLRQTEEVNGVAVNAAATHHVEDIVANVGGGLYAGIAGTVNVTVIGGETKAYVSGAVINKADAGTAGPDQGLSVKASDHAYANSFIGTLAVGPLGAGVGVGADVAVFSRDTKAYIQDSSDINAAGQVIVAARSSQGESSLATSGSGGIVGVVGTGTVGKFTGITEAYVSSSNVNTASLEVNADHTSRIFAAAGGITVGGIAVGGTFAVGVDETTTKAHIDDANIIASGEVAVEVANTVEIRPTAVSGSAAGAAAVAGSVAIDLVDSTTQAYVVNSRIGSAAQNAGSLRVEATDSVTVANTAGAAGLAGGLGVGAGAAVTKVANTVSAYIDGSEVYSAGDITVAANESRNLDTTAVAGGVGKTVGIGGAVAVALVGGGLSEDAAGELNSDGAGTLAAVDSFTSADRLEDGSNISTSGGPLSTGELNDLNSAARTGVTANLDPAALAGQTSASVNSSRIISGGNLDISADDRSIVATKAGGSAGGALGVGGAAAIASIEPRVNSFVGSDSVVETLGDVSIRNYSFAGGSVQSYAGAAGIVGLGAAVSNLSSDNDANAYLAGSTAINKADEVRITSQTVSWLDAKAYGATAGAAAVGVVIADAEETGTTAAYVGSGTRIGGASDPAKTVDSVTITGKTAELLNAESYAAAGGILSGSGSVATATATPTVRSYLGDDAGISAAGAITVLGLGSGSARADAEGLNIGGLTVGVSDAEANWRPDIKAYTGNSASLTAGSDVNILAYNNYNAAGAAETWKSSSYAASAAGALIGGSGADADTNVDTLVQARIGDQGSVAAGGNVNLTAKSHNDVKAEANGHAYGVAAGGSTDAVASVDHITRAYTGTGASLQAANVYITATADYGIQSKTTSGVGGLLGSGGTQASVRMGDGNDNGGNAKNKTEAYVGTDSTVAAAGTVEVGARKAVWMEANTVGDAAGAVADNESQATASYRDGLTHAFAADRARINAGRITVSAHDSLLDINAVSTSTTEAAASSSTATTDLDVNALATAGIMAGTDLRGREKVTISARQDNVKTAANSEAHVTGALGLVEATADSNLTATSRAYADPGSAIRTPELEVKAVTPDVADGWYRRAATYRAAAAWSDTYELGAQTRGNEIYFNASVYAFSPRLAIDAAGNVTEAQNITYTADADRITLGDIGASSTPRITLETNTNSAHTGRITGTANFNSLEEVNIANASEKDIYLQDIGIGARGPVSLNVSNTSGFSHQYSGGTNINIANTNRDSDLHLAGTISAASPDQDLSLTMNSARDIYFEGSITNYESLLAEAIGNIIDRYNSGSLTGHNTTLVSDFGQIGGAEYLSGSQYNISRPIRVNMTSVTTPYGTSSGSVGARANGGIFLDLNNAYKDASLSQGYSLMLSSTAGAVNVAIEDGGTYEILGINAGGAIAIDNPSRTATLNLVGMPSNQFGWGALISGAKDLSLTIDNDSVSNAYFDKTAAGIDLRDLLFANPGISLTAGALTGSGTLRIQEGHPRISIVNNTDLDLTVHNIYAEGSSGHISFNGDTDFSSNRYGTIQVVREGYDTGNVNITSTGSGNVIFRQGNLAGYMGIQGIENSTGATAITAQGAILAGSSDYLITSQDITLSANQIGESAANLRAKLTGGALNATATGSIFLTETSGALAGSTITSTAGDVTLHVEPINWSTIASLGTVGAPAGNATVTTTGQGIQDGKQDGTSNVNANNITLTALEGFIGSSGSPIRIDSGTAGTGRVTATAKNSGIYLEETAGDLVADNLTTTSGSVGLTVNAGAARLGTIAAGTLSNGAVSVTASGSILDGKNDGTDNISAGKVTLTAQDGAIGAAGVPVRINFGLAPENESLAATAGSGIWMAGKGDTVLLGGVRTEAGPVDLAFNDQLVYFMDTVEAASGNVSVSAGQFSTSPYSKAWTNLRGNDITIRSHGLTDWTGGIDLRIDSSSVAPGKVTAESSGNISLEETAGDMTLGSFRVGSRGGPPSWEGNKLTLAAAGSFLSGGMELAAPNKITLSAGGSVGTAANPISFNTPQLDVTGGTGVFLTKAAGDANFGNVTAQAGDIGLTVAAGNAQLGTITAQAGNVSVNASGSISDGKNDGTANVSAKGITIAAQNGSIGSGSIPVKIDSSYGGAGTAAATAQGDIYLTETAGDGNFRTVTSQAGDIGLTVTQGDAQLGTITANTGVSIAASGSINDAKKDGTANVQAPNMTLTAQTGSIGELFVDGLVNATAGNDVIITDPAGDLRIGTVRAGAIAALTAQGSLLRGWSWGEGTITAGEVHLTSLQGDVSLLEVNFLPDGARKLSAFGNNVTLDLNPGAAAPMTVTIDSLRAGGQADLRIGDASTYRINELTAGDVIINGGNATLEVAGTVTAGAVTAGSVIPGSLNTDFIMNSDGSVTANGLGYTDSTGGVSLADIRLGGGDIFLSGASLTGSGLLKSFSGYRHVRVRNDSSKSLTLNDIEFGPAQYGFVRFNGAELPEGANGSLLVVKEKGYDSGAITVQSNGAADLLLNGRLANPSGQISLAAFGNIMASGADQLVAAKDLDLWSQGKIGTGDAPLKTDLAAGGKLTAFAMKDLRITETAGDLFASATSNSGSVSLNVAAGDALLGQVKVETSGTGRDITVTASGGISDGKGDGTANIVTAGKLTLNARDAAIGTPDQPVQIALWGANPSLAATAGADVNLNVGGISADPTSVNVDTLKAGQGNVSLFLRQGGTYNLGEITAPGSITINNPTKTATLNLTGTLESGFGIPFDLSLDIAADGTLSADSKYFSVTTTPSEIGLGYQNAGRSIDLTAGTLTGGGTIKARDGYSHIAVTNNSSRDLKLNGFDLGGSTVVSFNGDTNFPSDKYGAVKVVKDASHAEGALEVSNNGNSTTWLNGIIANETGLTRIANAGGDITAVAVNPVEDLLVAKNIELDGRNILVGVDIRGGSLSATAQNQLFAIAKEGTDLTVSQASAGAEGMLLEARSGSIRLGTITTPGAVQVWDQGAVGSILNAKADGTANITANYASLSAPGGTIGTAESPLRILAPNVGAGAGQDVHLLTLASAQNVSARSSSGDVTVEAPQGDLNALNGLGIMGRNVTLRAPAGSVSVYSLLAQEKVTIAARGSIMNLFDTAAIYASEVSLAAGGDIGLPESPLNIQQFSALSAAGRNLNLSLFADSNGADLQQLSAANDISLKPAAGTYNIYNLTAGRKVNIEDASQTAVLNILGTVAAGLPDKDVTVAVAPDGTVTANVPGLFSSREGNTLTLGNIGEEDAGITLLAGALTGDGTLQTFAGSPHVSVTNDSDFDLKLGGIAAEQAQGVVSFNGDSTFASGAYGDVQVAKVQGYDTGAVTIANRGNADIILGGTIANSSGLTQISALRDITSTGESQLIVTKDLSLSGRNIGDATAGIRTEMQGGTLTAAATGNLYLTETAGDLVLGNIAPATGHISLQAAGSILDGLNTGGNVLAARNITLAAAGGNIGTADTPFRIDSASGGAGSLTATAEGDVVITETAGDLATNQVTSATENVVLNVLTGSLNAGTISATAEMASITATASGSILDGKRDGTVNFDTRSLTLTAGTGSLGTSTNPLITRTSGLIEHQGPYGPYYTYVDAFLNASAQQGIYLDSKSEMDITTMTSQTGNISLNSAYGLKIGTISALGADVDITAHGLSGKGNGASNINAANLTLTDVGGSWNSRLYIDLTDGLNGSLTAQGQNASYDIFETSGDLRVASMLVSGRVTLTAANGSILAVGGTNPTIDAGSFGANLFAENGTIGTAEAPILVKTKSWGVSDSSSLTARAKGDINVTFTSDQMQFGYQGVTSTEGDVRLTAPSFGGYMPATVEGNNILLLATEKGIGGVSYYGWPNPITVKPRESVTAYAVNDVVLRGIGNLPLDSVISATGQVNLTAQGFITDAKQDGSANIVAASGITLNSETAGIGAADAVLRIDSAVKTAGNVMADARQGIYLNETTGDLTLVHALSTVGDVTLTVPGAILSGQASSANLRGGHITLTAGQGGIGTAETPLGIVFSQGAGAPSLTTAAAGGVNLSLNKGATQAMSVAIEPITAGDSVALTLEDGSTYHVQGITAPGTVAIVDNAGTATLDTAGDITSGRSGWTDINVTIAQDGTVSSPSLGYTFVDSGQSLLLDHIRSRSGIQLTAGTVTGSGTLKALGGNAHVSIVNDSSLNLILKDIEVTPEPGVNTGISINGQTDFPSGALGSLRIVREPGYETGAISIAGHGQGDIKLAGVITNSSGLTTLSNQDGGIFATGGSQLLSSQDLTLAAAAGIGSQTLPLNTEILGGSLTATSAGNIYLSEKTGNLATSQVTSTAGSVTLATPAADLSLGTISAAGKASITAGSIVSGSVNAGSITLTAQSGGITAGVNNGLLTATAPGSITIAGLSDINVDRIVSTGGHADLAASGAILSGRSDGTANIEALSISLAADHGGIGAGSRHLKVDTAMWADGTLNATAAGDIFIDETTGDLLVDVVKSSGGNVYLTSAWSLQASRQSILGGRTNVQGNYIFLEAQNGDISGQKTYQPYSEFLHIDSSRTLWAKAKGNIHIAEDAGDLLVLSVTSRTGDVKLAAPLNTSGSILGGRTDWLPNIQANSVWLEARNGDIGTGTYPLVIDSSYSAPGKLDASAGRQGVSGGIFIDEVLGLNLGQIYSYGGGVSLHGSWWIRGGSIQVEGAGDVALSAASIGTQDSYLTIDSLPGKLTADASGGIFISGSTGDLRVNHIASLTGDVGLKASESLLAENIAGSNVSGNNITLSGEGIGTEATPLRIDSSVRVPGTVTVDSPGSIFLVETAGDLRAGRIASAAGDVSLTAAGAILDGKKDGTANVAGRHINLTGQTGGIGTYSNALNISFLPFAEGLGDPSLTVLANAAVNLDLNRGAQTPMSVFLNRIRTGDQVSLSIEDASTYHVNEITAGGRISLNNPARTATLDIVGSVTSGAKDVNVAIDSQGVVTSDYLGYAPVKTGSEIVLGNFNSGRSGIAITAGTFTGSGTLNSFAGFAHFNVTNDSNLDLRVNDVVTGAAWWQPTISFNGKAVETTGGLAAFNDIKVRADFGYNTGGVAIRNNGTADILLNGRIANPNGPTEVTAAGDILAVNAEQVIATKDLTLSARQIGSQSAAIRVDQPGAATLRATATGAGGVAIAAASTTSLVVTSISSAGDVTLNSQDDIWVGTINNQAGNVTLTGGNVYTGTIDAQAGNVTVNGSRDITAVHINAPAGNVTLTGGGDILAGTMMGTPNVTANGITLAAQNGSIGPNPSASGDATFLRIDSAKSAAGVVTAQAKGKILLAETAGDLNVGAVTSTAGDVQLTAEGSILDGKRDGTTNISANNITLAATTGDIGNWPSGHYLSMNSSLASAGTVNAMAARTIYLREISGNLNVGQIKSTAGENVYIETITGSVLNAAGSSSAAGQAAKVALGPSAGERGPVAAVVLAAVDNASNSANLIGGDIVLDVQGGTIGSADNRIAVNSMGTLDSTASGAIYLEAQGGDLHAGKIESTTGLVDILASAGDATIGQISSPESVKVVVAGDALAISQAQASALDLSVLQQGGSVQVDDALVKTGIVVSADYITLAKVAALDVKTPLHLDMSGFNGTKAEEVKIQVSKETELVIDRMLADDVKLEFPVRTIGADAGSIELVEQALFGTLGFAGDDQQSGHHGESGRLTSIGGYYGVDFSGLRGGEFTPTRYLFYDRSLILEAMDHQGEQEEEK